jgi:signal recognition particle GTPase
MGTVNTDLNLAAAPPAIVLMAGLQGAGKTTTVAKLAKFLKERKEEKVMVVSCDVHRPAAIEQLRTLAEQVDVLFIRAAATRIQSRSPDPRRCGEAQFRRCADGRYGRDACRSTRR